MKHDTNTLLLASEVRQLAKLLHADQLQQATASESKAYRAASTDADAEAQKARLEAARSDWLDKHPLSEFFLPALAKLEEVADVITRQRA